MNISVVGLQGIWAPSGSLDSFNGFFIWLLDEVEVHWQHVRVAPPKQTELFDTLLMAVENTAHQDLLQDLRSTWLSCPRLNSGS